MARKIKTYNLEIYKDGKTGNILDAKMVEAADGKWIFCEDVSERITKLEDRTIKNESEISNLHRKIKYHGDQDLVV